MRFLRGKDKEESGGNCGSVLRKRYEKCNSNPISFSGLIWVVMEKRLMRIVVAQSEVGSVRDSSAARTRRNLEATVALSTMKDPETKRNLNELRLSTLKIVPEDL